MSQTQIAIGPHFSHIAKTWLQMTGMCRYRIEIDSTPKPGVPYRIGFLLEKIKISNSDSDRRFVRSNGQHINHRNKDLEINGTSTRINSSPGASGHILLNENISAFDDVASCH